MLCNSWPAAPSTTFFSPTDVPLTVNNTDNAALVLGVRFNAELAGDVTGFRFFKAAGERGATHAGHIYDWVTGQLLASTGRVIDTHCVGPGWVSAPLLAPLRTVAGGQYVVAVDSVLFYPKTPDAFSASRPRAGMTLLQAGGVFGFKTNEIPRMNFGGGTSNYWVDGT